MGTIHICFVLSFSVAGSELPDTIEELYQKKYKKILSFLYAHQDMCITLFVPGIVLEWIEKKHPEITSVCLEMINRRQIEILGGGYYEPLFPLLLPVDRVAQIEALTTAIRKATGKRPRGAFLTESVWDPSLVYSFNTCSIEYTLLDSRLIPQSQFKPISSFLPIVMEDMGKTTTVIPLHQSSMPQKGQSPVEYLHFTHTVAQSGDSSVLACLFTPANFLELMESKWFENFLTLLKNDQIASLSVPQRYLKQYKARSRTYIPAGCMSDAALWTLEPFVPHTRVFTEAIRPTVKDFLTVYPESNRLYSRMMYVSMLINQCRGDKARKKAAKEELWAAQNFAAYIYTGKGGISDKVLRGKTYRHLLQAEKLARSVSGFKENSSAFDFSMSGGRDFLCCFAPFNAFFGLQGGALFEFDVLQNTSNYCSTTQRSKKIDGIADTYEKKMFTDHLWDKEDFAGFISGNGCPGALFPSVRYTEVSFDRIKSEIKLSADIVWGKKEIPISLKKNYSVSSNGIICQYILKNKGTQDLQAKFAVEHNLAVPGDSAGVLNAEVIAGDVKESAVAEQAYVKKTGVSMIRLTDSASDIHFMFEPNEQCGFYLQPFFTQSSHAYEIKKIKNYEAHTCAFFWDVCIPPGMETEKILNLTLVTAEKCAVAKKAKKR